MDKAIIRFIFIFFIGFSSLIYQIYSVRILFMFFVENTRAVSLAISCFLAGIASSSLLFSRLTNENRRNVELLSFMTFAAGFYGYVVLTNYQLVPIAIDAVKSLHLPVFLSASAQYSVMWLYLFLPAFFLGGAFPLVNGLHLTSLRDSSRDTGTIYAWDTTGAILGALLAGFVLLPYLGIRATVITAVAVNFLLAAWLMQHRALRCTLLLALCVILAHEFSRLSSPVQMQATSPLDGMMPSPHALSDLKFKKMLFQENSPYGRVTVGSWENGGMTLFINFRSMCSNIFMSGEDDIATMLLSQMPSGSKVLNIGLGCGITAGTVASHHEVASLDIVEINPVVSKAARLFKSANHDVLNSPKASLHIQNGTDWLRTTTTLYDGIVIDIEEASVIYSSPLYTREYFEIARSRLKEDGVFALWSFKLSPEFTKVMHNTLKSVFPHVVMRHGKSETTYYASMRPLSVPEKDAAFSRQVLAATIDDINTVENAALEKHFNINNLFSLPSDYREEFVRYRN